ncbi:MAG: restriction endonuclease [Lachnospiraceae bacterium]|nr:restriction endonuclease [Lachnospiraceae bacterium]MDD7148628.1 restriction endonuclease [Lachnospiraceae bacterium]MDY4069855.1 restriction endonuclease [Lachnospiraceae bacterium]
MNTIWPVAGIGIICIFAVIIYGLIRRRRKELPFDSMEGHDFERFCADLLKARGFLEVEVTKGSGDFGVDILAEKDGISYAFQCKRYDEPVGVKAVQEIYAGRDYYDRQIGVVMTNQYFTAPAVEAARKLKILLWDRGYLEEMMEETSWTSTSL